MDKHLETVIQFIQGTHYKQIPNKAKEMTKLAFIDTLAVTLAANDETETKIVRDLVSSSELNEQQYMSSIQVAFSSNPRDFAFLFGTMSHVLDFDDVNFTFHGHPSVTLIPIILALSKEHGFSGKEMITAYAVGFEVQARIGEAIGSDQYQIGLHTTATIGIYGAISAACKLLNFNEKEIRHAFGLASSLAAGSRKNFGTMTKPLHVGFVAENAYRISQLIKLGITAADDVFSDPLPMDMLTTGRIIGFKPLMKLGQQWELEDFGFIVKKYPCCAFTHRSIDALLEIVQNTNIDEENLDKIEVFVHYKVPTVLIYPEAKTGLEGKFSMEYCLAAAFLDKEIKLASFTDEKVNRDAIRRIMEKVIMKIDPEQEEGTNPKEQKAKVEVYTNGGVLKREVEFPIGHPGNPFSEMDVAEKFSDCIGTKMEEEGKEELMKLLGELEDKKFIDLEALLTKAEVRN